MGGSSEYHEHSCKPGPHPLQSDIMRDNMIINMSGHPGKAEGMDKNIEHLIRNDKVRPTIWQFHRTEYIP